MSKLVKSSLLVLGVLLLIAIAAGLLIIIYAGIIGLAQDWTHVWQQTAELWYRVLALVATFFLTSRKLQEI